MPPGLTIFFLRGYPKSTRWDGILWFIWALMGFWRILWDLMGFWRILWNLMGFWRIFLWDLMGFFLGFHDWGSPKINGGCISWKIPVKIWIFELGGRPARLGKAPNEANESIRSMMSENLEEISYSWARGVIMTCQISIQIWIYDDIDDVYDEGIGSIDLGLLKMDENCSSWILTKCSDVWWHFHMHWIIGMHWYV